ncbi:hypothetical protein ONZ43_g6733 [Nemania bipapillata]|uniref:Uncharacterized protein n=1 Tax=Nemania bipapillata TaxID=110536 RepID=A0ACC2HXA4_9PEZI|nr:hypothetical protein ONZ43_g6733 [Nemania bipapillata]
MTDTSFESHKRSVVVKRLEKLKNLDQETGRHWAQISNEYYDFEAAQHDAAHVEKLTKAEMIDFYKTFIDPSSPSRAKLVVQLIAQGASSKTEVDAKKEEVTPPISNGTKPVLITSVRDFKARMAATAGPRAVHDLSEFEELDSKL